MNGHDLAEGAGPTSDDARWSAVVERDPHADGRFVYAVATTGIYCRPTCPSRRPRRTNVSFFSTPSDAEAAGFRACLRCVPGEVTAEQRMVAAVQRLLESAEDAPTLADLGDAVGLSPWHLQRAFKRATGMSPKQYATALAGERLKRELRNADTVAAAQYEAGFESARAAYQVGTEQLGMTPGRFRRGGAGETIRFTHADGPFGRFLVAVTHRGVCALRFGADDATEAELRAEFPAATLVEDIDGCAGLATQIRDHLATLKGTLTLALDVGATEFQRRVWSALRAIPAGETRTYGEIATEIGAPQAVRAVARACATNPVAVVIPCHRVIRANGGLSGYRWGVERKRRLLEVEAAGAKVGERPLQ